MKNNKNKNRIYKNKTRNKEVEIINLYSRSKESDKEAEKKLKILNICFSSISAFMSQDHNKIVNELYFNSKYNVIDDKIVKMLGVVALTESTMKRYRDKYCLVADLVFSMLNEIEL